MPDSAPRSHAKQPTQKKRTLDGHQRCYSYLGEVGALAFYTYCALRHDVSLSELVVWSNRLLQAILTIPDEFRPKQDAQLERCDLVVKRAIGRPQVSLWKKSAPMRAEEAAEGAEVRAASFRIDGIDEKDDSIVWSGHLLFVFDARTNSLIHHFAAYNLASRQLSADALLYGLNKALEQIQALRGEGETARVRTLEINGLGADKAAYQEACQRLSADGALEVRWQGRSNEENLLGHVSAATSHTETLSVQTYYPSSLTFKNTLVRVAREFEKSNSTSSEKKPCNWLSLNTLKASEKKDPKRFDRV